MPRRKAALVRFDTQDLERVARALKRANPALERDFTKAIRNGGAMVVLEARRRAAQIPSRRIPRTIQMRDARGRIGGSSGKGVAITVGGPSAPHARVFEPSDGRTRVAHPVFARGPRKTWTWRDQRTHPYMRPALEHVRRKIEQQALDAAVTSIHRSLGG